VAVHEDTFKNYLIYIVLYYGFDFDEWESKAAEDKPWFDFLCGNHTRNLPLDEFNKVDMCNVISTARPERSESNSDWKCIPMREVLVETLKLKTSIALWILVVSIFC
jgi:hypothetical protein